MGKLYKGIMIGTQEKMMQVGAIVSRGYYLYLFGRAGNNVIISRHRILENLRTYSSICNEWSMIIDYD